VKDMTKRIIPVGLLVLAVVGIAWWLTHRQAASRQIVLYGNVDLREVDLAFNDSQRIVKVQVQEGDRVHKGQVLALLDTSRLTPQLEQAQAQADSQAAVVQRLLNGSRPQEIAQARANLSLAQADARQARDNYLRIDQVFQSSSGRAVSRQDLDNAKAQWDVAQARAAVNHKALELAVIGPRKEDIAQAQAMLQADRANVALLEQELADATLKAPLDAVVRSRVAEPGDMASPQKTAFTLAITDPKWVRAYVSEKDLGLVRSGMTAAVQVDSFPNRRFDGWIGFISPVAEFTPKTVQTSDLRSSLVYQIRVFVKDPGDDLRLGMPATVYLPLSAKK
jgi:HlyD family secretion protein